MTVSAMKGGAVEFLTKPLNAPALLEAIRHAIERDREERAERKRLDELRRRYDSLTPREREVNAQDHHWPSEISRSPPSSAPVRRRSRSRGHK